MRSDGRSPSRPREVIAGRGKLPGTYLFRPPKLAPIARQMRERGVTQIPDTPFTAGVISLVCTRGASVEIACRMRVLPTLFRPVSTV
jgi:hypothetical protein